MGMEVLLPIILQYSIPVAMQIWQMATRTTPITQADWDTLTAMANQTAADRMKAQLAAAGISPTDPKYAALLALAS